MTASCIGTFFSFVFKQYALIIFEVSIRASDLGDHNLEGLKVKNVRDCEFAKNKGDCDEVSVLNYLPDY